MAKETKTEEQLIGQIEPAPLVDEMKESYMDYAMSVIVQRALPDVRDGLKPVHRRILYAMQAVGLRHTAKFRKSATIVGEVIGKYHPHGDTAVYDTMVRLAQDFSMRYPLVWGQGNFGSMDGDSAAAYRYTEAKMTALADEVIADLDKDTVDFVPNFDGSHTMPSVMPSKVPQLLLNGTLGIAVGMATDIPPHNLNEISEAMLELIDNPEATIGDLVKHVSGPDFPTGGVIYNKKDIEAAYATGRGGIVVRAKTDIEEMKNGMFQIIVTEVPYRVNKANLIEKIANLVQEKKIEEIKDLRDESNKDGVRIVIELKKDAYPKKVLNRLFKLTQLQDTFHVNMLALVEEGKQPRVLNLKMMLEEFIAHRKVVVKRRAEYELAKAKERAHILEGLHKALGKIDAIIDTIKKSKDKEAAKENLMKKFKFSERQTIAILEMRLQNLANLERKKIEDELKEKLVIIKDLESLLASNKKILAVIKKEVKEMQEKYGDERRTKVISHGVKDFAIEDLIPNESTLVMATVDGYIKRLPPDTFKQQSRGGKGIVGLTTKEEDVVQQMIITNTHDDLLFFTNRGRVFQLKAYEIPQTSRTAKGQAMQNFLQLAPNEKVSSIISLDDISGYEFLVMVTTKGTIKKVDIKSFETVRRSGLIALKLKEGDDLEWVRPSSGKDELMLASADGQGIRFAEKAIRAMGRTAGGVRGMRLKESDEIIGMDVVDPNLVKKGLLEAMVITEKGMGKRTALKEYKLQGRGGTGVKTANVSAKTGKIVSMRVINKDDLESDLLIISSKGQTIRLPLKSVPSLGRATQGVRVMRFKTEGDSVAGVTLI